VTLFGDAILPRGGALSLASLVAIMRSFRIGEGVVRTAMSRLVQDGLFVRATHGRNSFFSVSKSAAKLFVEASDRIYRAPVAAWDGTASLCLIEGADRAAVRASLAAQGFAQLAPELMIAIPAPSPPPASEGAIALPIRPPLADARRLVARGWPLEELAERYRTVLNLFGEFAEPGGPAEGAASFVVRTLLIHYHRRAVLRDPRLPLVLMPEDWPGRREWELCATLYRRNLMESERWLQENAANAQGALPAADPELMSRFTS
jgi:phenylacetic acid degradation operon negative regulatory protein